MKFLVEHFIFGTKKVRLALWLPLFVIITQFSLSYMIFRLSQAQLFRLPSAQCRCQKKKKKKKKKKKIVLHQLLCLIVTALRIFIVLLFCYLDTQSDFRVWMMALLWNSTLAQKGVQAVSPGLLATHESHLKVLFFCIFFSLLMSWKWCRHTRTMYQFLHDSNMKRSIKSIAILCIPKPFLLLSHFIIPKRSIATA